MGFAQRRYYTAVLGTFVPWQGQWHNLSVRCLLLSVWLYGADVMFRQSGLEIVSVLLNHLEVDVRVNGLWISSL
jgi:hypothetical protein